ncbi:unnamed protein product [Effrenium voratum]|uniref:Uncharacterized protein n=1 Tax=Effrenium voratum TaxID=2562239 RepID=A0AA36I1E3_9DINO|nr:unnamed protein product [Effrenium voratum]CAJ1444665.1 unnamed protein product [Effrenium voratum]
MALFAMELTHWFFILASLPLVSKVSALLRALYHLYLRPATSFASFRGDYALVTGASRGIGRGYSLALARRGVNLILAASSPEPLEKLAEECRALGVEARVLQVDFAPGGGLLLTKVQKQLEELVDLAKISILVNNLGGKPPDRTLPTAPIPMRCEDIDAETYENYLAFNAHVGQALTSMLLPIMVQRNKGYVLNVSSLNGNQVIPFLSAYCATKAYISSYSACLNAELRARRCNVWVEAVCPGPVATESIGNPKPSAKVPDPVRFAEQSLRLARTPFAQVPWPRHWWSMQYYGNGSMFVSDEVAQRRLRNTYFKMWG